ncbi:MAG: T9SS type A sorting domain-containing protein [Chitinophagaceae bacterium]
MKKNVSSRYFLAAIFSITTIIASAQNVFKVTTGAVIKTTGGVVITLQDMNLDNDGTISQAPGEGVFRFSGTQDNTISGTSAPLFDVLEIAKTGSAKTSLQRFINVGSGINFISGLINLNNNNLFLQPAALLNSESEISRIIGVNGGYIEITKTLNVPSSANPGNLGAIISSSQNLGSTIIRRGHTSQINGSGIGSSIFRYYDILPLNNTALNATLQFKYFDAELNGFNENTIVLWKSTNNTTWTQQGFTSRDATSNYVEKTGIADFSRWTLSSVNNPLPVQFILFNVKCESNKVVINWKTAQENNSSHFNIEQSTDGINWSVTGSVPAAGNSTDERSYSFIDNNPVQNSFYRIAECDINGRSQYTSILKVSCDFNDVLKVWPNPVSKMVFVNINTNSRSTAVIKVFDTNGALIKVQRTALLQGNNQVNMDMEKFPAGMYQLMIEWNNGQMKKTVQVIRQ